jgi:hypothetical protein
MRRILVFLTLVVAALTLTAPGASAGTFTLYSPGDNVVVTPGPGGEPAAFKLTSDAAGAGRGGMYWTAPAGFTLGDLTTLSANYQMTNGSFDGWAPRFSLWGPPDQQAFVNWGTSGTLNDPLSGAWGNTGNLASTSSLDIRVNTNGYGFGAASINYPHKTFIDFVTAAGSSTPIYYISIDLDSGWGSPGKQVMLVDDFTVNGDVFDAAPPTAPVPEPASMFLLGTGLVGLRAWKKRKA